MPRWMNHNLERRCWEYNQESQICRWYHSNGRKWRVTKETLDEVKEESEKAGLNPNIQKTKIVVSSPITSWEMLFSCSVMPNSLQPRGLQHVRLPPGFTHWGTAKPNLYGERNQIVLASRKKGGLTGKGNKGTFWDDGNVLCAASVVATNRMWVLSTWPVASVTEELNVCYI